LATATFVLSAAGADAATFSAIANIPGGPQIGAVRDGILYGTLPHSGAGLLFKLGTNGRNYTVAHAFIAGRDGSAPNARLAIDSAGNLFGTTRNGGAYNQGTLWEYSAAHVMSTPHVFGANGDGGSPMQGPTLGGQNTIYGAASMGANGNSGNLFELVNETAYRDLYKFESAGDGHCPYSGVAVAPGAVYGTVVGYGYGGNPNGSVWQFTARWGLRTLYVFQNGNDGEWPDQAPIDAAGNIYGTTHIHNGKSFAGAVWKIDTWGNFSVVHDLVGATDGYGPNSPLLLDKNGNLYGTSLHGGAYNLGTVYRITPSGGFSVVHTFANNSDGAEPTGNLVNDGYGMIYGGTASGTVFKIVP
jgi:uncharacterized repeat protein (TIGR03803 family)